MRSVLLTAAAAAALIVAAPAGATGIHGLTTHDRDVIRFFVNHPRLARTAAGGAALSETLPHVVVALRTLQDAEPFVAHEALWRCIAGYPGARPGGGTGESGGDNAATNGSHWGILQMTWGWGDGIEGDPAGYSPQEIMEAAERGYDQAEADGDLDAWLDGQWGATIGPCWQFV